MYFLASLMKIKGFIELFLRYLYYYYIICFIRQFNCLNYSSLKIRTQSFTFFQQLEWKVNSITKSVKSRNILLNS